MSSMRDALRAAGLKSREGKRITVVFEDQEYEVRAPSVRARSKILTAAGLVDTDDQKGKGKKTQADAGKMQVCAVIACTFAPGTDERVFEDADVETLLDDPAGGIVDAVGEHALKFLNASADKDAAKNG